MATPIQTTTGSGQDQAVEQKIQELRALFADAPEVGKTALENVLKELTSQVSAPRSRMESAGRIGSRQGTVSELTVIAPLIPGGAQRLRGFLRLLNGNFDGADRVGTVHDMRFVFLDNDTKMLFATTYDGDWDAYIDDFATKIPDYLDIIELGAEPVIPVGKQVMHPRRRSLGLVRYARRVVHLIREIPLNIKNQ